MPQVAAIFPGQGSHAEGMAEPWSGHPIIERGIELLGFDPFERLDEGTRFQQPAIFLCSIASWESAEDRDEVAAGAMALVLDPGGMSTNCSAPP